ncbi:hypothetical protein TNCV_3438431 [Trichonephila clavipes]|nr:hypothetical protein TNCV_3438431 [Trichonephila clavipes]
MMMEDLKQQLVYQGSPECALPYSGLVVKLTILFASNRDPQDSPQEAQIDLETSFENALTMVTPQQVVDLYGHIGKQKCDITAGTARNKH